MMPASLRGQQIKRLAKMMAIVVDVCEALGLTVSEKADTTTTLAWRGKMEPVQISAA